MLHDDREHLQCFRVWPGLASSVGRPHLAQWSKVSLYQSEYQDIRVLLWLRLATSGDKYVWDCVAA